MLPGLLWEWTKTTTPPRGRGAGWNRTSAASPPPDCPVALLWRAHVPAPGRRLWPRGTDREAIDVRLAEAREVLANDDDTAAWLQTA